MRNRFTTNYASGSFLVGLGIFGYLTFVSLWIGIVIGWILNVIQILGMLDTTATGLLVMKAVGVILVPLGGILGWLGL